MFIIKISIPLVECDEKKESCIKGMHISFSSYFVFGVIFFVFIYLHIPSYYKIR